MQMKIQRTNIFKGSKITAKKEEKKNPKALYDYKAFEDPECRFNEVDNMNNRN